MQQKTPGQIAYEAYNASVRRLCDWNRMLDDTGRGIWEAAAEAVSRGVASDVVRIFNEHSGDNILMPGLDIVSERYGLDSDVAP